MINYLKLLFLFDGSLFAERMGVVVTADYASSREKSYVQLTLHVAPSFKELKSDPLLYQLLHLKTLSRLKTYDSTFRPFAPRSSCTVPSMLSLHLYLSMASSFTPQPSPFQPRRSAPHPVSYSSCSPRPHHLPPPLYQSVTETSAAPYKIVAANDHRSSLADLRSFLPTSDCSDNISTLQCLDPSPSSSLIYASFLSCLADNSKSSLASLSVFCDQAPNRRHYIEMSFPVAV